MHYTATADTDIGNVKSINQDSLLIRQASYPGGEVLLAVVCDGMGGLAKGELASATVIRAFARWFEAELPLALSHPDLNGISTRWVNLLREQNRKILDYSNATGGDRMGTTFSGLLLLGDSYLFAHVGDSRIYQIGSSVNQMTEDQTFVAREIKRGAMTPEEARTHKRRNQLLQCVGAMEYVNPQVQTGRAERGAYMLCSDGFRHEISEREMYESLNPVNLMNKSAMHSNARYLIDLVKSRGERDNISVILIKAE